MAFDFKVFNRNRAKDSQRLQEDYVQWLVSEYAMAQVLRYEKLWSYYRNDMEPLSIAGNSAAFSESARPYRQRQEYGLPSRITGMQYSFYGGIMSGERVEGIRRKEVVIENDIAWRIDTMVDFLFGREVHITSRVEDAARKAEIEAILQAVFAANGGAAYLQTLALLGSVYGFVDVIVRLGELQNTSEGGAAGEEEFAGLQPKSFNAVLQRAKTITLEAIEAPRSLPILDTQDYRRIRYYIQHYRQVHPELKDENAPGVIFAWKDALSSRQKETHNVEIIAPDYWQRYKDELLVATGRNPLGVVPVVHIQNMTLPGYYEGQSDVEPLIALQDELNTRLSDRANRITFQSFKMYLGKGIEGFEDRAVAPGRMWSTENPEARIEEFGGDEGSPSEEAHINHIREALDKASGVASVAAGILKGRIGNLTSAVALKMTLMGVLAKTQRKRKCYGEGIAQLCRLILLALDKTGWYPNQPHEREIDLHWPDPLPENVTEKLQEAQMKKNLGISTRQILKELGYYTPRNEE